MRTTSARPGKFRLGFDRLEGRDLMATLPAGFTEAVVASGLSDATAMEFAPDGRLFIAEQGGTMEVFQGGSRLQANFFRDAPLAVDSAGERGLLGVAFDPDYAANRFVYAYYTATSPVVHNRLSRFTADASGTLALAGSERVLLDIDPLSAATNHNGGAIHFGPDGKLYIAVGDNASAANAQTLGNLKGKILRLNPDGSIPADNPFVEAASGQNRAIWALGLRNPFTFTFQPGTGRMFINDVGQDTFEEIDQGAPGANFGWPTTEGPTADPRFVAPFFAYDHSQGQAITGGAFYDPATPRFPADFTGDYFFADFGAGTIRTIDTATKEVSAFASGVPAPVDLRVGDDGGLYYLSRGLGQVLRIDSVAAQGQSPTVLRPPSDQFVTSGEPATFTVEASGTPPLTYQWQRDGVDIPAATSSTFAIASPTLADDGRRIGVIVSNAFGAVASLPATLVVLPNTSRVNLRAEPAGLQLLLDGQPVAGSGSFVGVVGEAHTLEAPATQTIGGVTYQFAGWSDGGTASHVLVLPGTDATLTASYQLAAARINFQPAGAPVPAGYEADTGSVFGARARGLNFGWNVGNSATARDRNSPLSPGQAYDTFQQIRSPSAARSRWEIAVPDGTYTVRVVAGDPSQINGDYRILAEGATVLRARPSRRSRWIDGTVTVRVTDGRLTISGASGARNNKINFIEITRAT